VAVTNKDVAHIEENIDVVQTIQKQTTDLYNRAGPIKSTKDGAERVMVKTGELLRELKDLKGSIERDEDVV
jgi:hypothetical protein